MLQRQDDVFFYLTVMNENHAQPSMPAGVEEGIVRGIYQVPAMTLGHEAPARPAAHCTLLGSGAILHEVMAASEMLAREWSIASDVFSVTSFSELARDGMSSERRADARDSSDVPYVTQALAPTRGPILAVTDYVRAVPEQLRAWIPGARRYATLGTDGFGRSDTRAQLRKYFEVDRQHIVYRALRLLVDEGELPRSQLDAARQHYGLPPETPDPWTA